MSPVSFEHLWNDDELSDIDVVLVAGEPHHSRRNKSGRGEPTSPTVLKTFPGHKPMLTQSRLVMKQLCKGCQLGEGSARQDCAAASNTNDCNAELTACLKDRLKPQDQNRRATQEISPLASTQHQRSDVFCGCCLSTIRPLLQLRLPDASFEQAAVAVLGSLYGVDIQLKSLSQHQQMQAAALADIWPIPGLTAAILQLISSAQDVAKTKGKTLSRETVSTYLQAFQRSNEPMCFVPFLGHIATACVHLRNAKVLRRLKRVLLSTYGDLEKVWRDAELRDHLMSAPLTLMELLLSYDELQVASEDTVLYTFQEYVGTLEPERRPSETDLRYVLRLEMTASQFKNAEERLSPLIRAPHLSNHWLAAADLPVPRTTYNIYKFKLQPLQRLKFGAPQLTLTPDNAPRLLVGCPASWGLGPRRIKPAVPATLEWQLDVSVIQQAVQRSYAEQGLEDCEQLTPPMSGVDFALGLYFKFSADSSSTQLGLHFWPNNYPSSAFLSYSYRLEVVGVGSHEGAATATAVSASNVVVGLFGMKAMSHTEGAGGWNAAEWEATGLPSNGPITVKLAMTGVGV